MSNISGDETLSVIDQIFIYSSAIYDTSIFQHAANILQCVNVGHIVNDYQPEIF
jgi:hypothetical protein